MSEHRAEPIGSHIGTRRHQQLPTTEHYPTWYVSIGLVLMLLSGIVTLILHDFGNQVMVDFILIFGNTGFVLMVVGFAAFARRASVERKRRDLFLAGQVHSLTIHRETTAAARKAGFAQRHPVVLVIVGLACDVWATASYLVADDAVSLLSGLGPLAGIVAICCLYKACNPVRPTPDTMSAAM